jgi:hypothetical protein
MFLKELSAELWILIPKGLARRRQLPSAQNFLGVQNLDTHELFVLADIEGNFLVQPYSAALVLAFDQANVEGVNFGIVANSHGSPARQTHFA